MAKDKNKKENEKKKKSGKTVIGVGILAILATLLGAFGLGLGNGNGTGSGNGETKQESKNEDYLMQSDQKPTVIPPATATPVAEQKKEDVTVVNLQEINVKISEDKVYYKDTETTAQNLADTLVAEYADTKENILVKVTLEDAVYDTVEALKVALEGKGIKYEITE